MFAALTAEPVRVRTALIDFTIPTSWSRPVRRVRRDSRRFELAPGVWIIREPQAWPVSVLDTGTLIPVPDVDPVKRIFPFVDWHEWSKCIGYEDRDRIFFGVDDEANPALPPAAIEEARQLCRSCPVIEQCLIWALTAKNQQADGFVTTGEKFGIWGGTTGRQRARLQLRIKSGESVEDLVAECLEML